MNKLTPLSESLRWKLMVTAAKRGAGEAGYKLTRLPGKGLSNVYEAERGGAKKRASIRTTRDRWIAFPPLKGGTVWKTLSDVDLVIVATVNSKEDPQSVQVFIFDAADVRKRFDQAYKSRTGAGNVVRDNFGMWVGLNLDHRGGVYTAGSGIAENVEPIASYKIDDLIKDMGDVSVADKEARNDNGAEEVASTQGLPMPHTIAEVKEWARHRAAEIAGVSISAVKIDLRIEY